MTKQTNAKRPKVKKTAPKTKSQTTKRRQPRKRQSTWEKMLKRLNKLERKHVIAAIVIVIAIGVVLSLSFALVARETASADVYNIVCRDKKTNQIIKPDTKVYKTYGISGYFMYTSSNGCYNRQQVERSHKMGANTLVTFGSTLKSVSSSALSSGNFSTFRPGGQNGYNYIKQKSGARINRIFTYSDKLTFSSKSLACGSKRNGVHTDSKGAVFTWWLFPTDSAYSSCSSPSNTYDLVVAYSPTKSDGNTILISNAARYGMKVYLGLPKPQPNPKVTYVADTSYTHTLGSFATRVLATWNQRFGSANAFAGVYQTLETPTFSNKSIWQPNLTVYTILNKVTQYRLPKAKERVLISPYADFKLQPTSTILSSYREIVKTGGGAHIILMPQDGVGTGRVGISRVDTLYSQAKKAGAAEFWANVEAFKPGGGLGKRTNTNKATLDSQIAHAKKYASKTLSYNWNYMESSGIARQILGSNY